MARNYTETFDGRIAVPDGSWAGVAALPAVMGEGMVRQLAREIADAMIADARSLEGPVVWVTGNQYMPPMRAIPQAERVYQAENNQDGELWAFLVEEVERHLEEASVTLQAPDYDNALYVVDLARWQYREDVPEAEDLNDEWERIPV